MLLSSDKNRLLDIIYDKEQAIINDRHVLLVQNPNELKPSDELDMHSKVIDHNVECTNTINSFFGQHE